MNEIRVVRKDELYHYGVKGMKWGVHRALKLQAKASASRASADAWSAKANHASSKGRIKKAEKYTANAEQDRAKAAKYDGRVVKKIENRYKRAGAQAGRAEYERHKGAEAVRKHERDAKVMDDLAKKYDSSGKIIKAEAARRSAEAIRERGKNISDEHERVAKTYLKSSDAANRKASEIATATNVNIGKKKVDSIIKNAKKAGYEDAKEWDDVSAEQNKRKMLGDDGYETYRYIRGR